MHPFFQHLLRWRGHPTALTGRPLHPFFLFFCPAFLPKMKGDITVPPFHDTKKETHLSTSIGVLLTLLCYPNYAMCLFAEILGVYTLGLANVLRHPPGAKDAY